ncbi:MAG: TIGR03936 family radical SAM-associated protein [Acidimicrobiales bacterium]|nr:TIGR03936 family radical SAM-associated protein [Acidimicrobiales bacterium]
MRVRFRFSKLGKVRFTSHRDVARLWERALRRAQLPVASTEGFAPRPKVHFGLALPTGYESLAEYLDVDLREPEAVSLDIDTLPEQLTPLLPEGISVDAADVVDPKAPSLQEAVTACEWRIEVPGLAIEAARREVERLLAAPTLPVVRQRKGKEVHDDIRPYLWELVVAGPIAAAEPGTELRAVFGTQPRGLRPAELLAAFEPPVIQARVCRLHQWITLGNTRREPLSAAAARAEHAEARA